MGKILSKLHKKLSAVDRTASSPSGVFTFSELPDVCKLHVLSYLSTEDRVSAARVCTEWHQLLRAPMLWTDVDIPASVGQQRRSVRYAARREAVYKSRVKKYLEFVGDVNPGVQRFVFEGDIMDTEYHNMLESFVDNTRLAELRQVNIDWNKHTQSTDTPTPTELPHSDDNHRRRQRLFVRLFEKFSRCAPNVTSLTLPFDWSPKSIEALCRLQKVECLKLRRYSELQALDSVTLERLLRGLSHLRRLELEVWTPCATGGLSFFSLRSNTLEAIDVSQCRGFAVGEVSLPNLKVLDVSRQPWSGPLAIKKDGHMLAAVLPCLHRILSEGAPQLRSLNGHSLHRDWRENVYEELDSVLKSVCPCELHCDCSLPVDECF